MRIQSGSYWFCFLLVFICFEKEVQSGPFGYYPTLTEIDTIIDGLKERHPEIVTRGVLTPKTIENRDIFYVKISNSPDADNKKPEALITGAQHSCEVIGPACVRLDMYNLCNNYDTDPEIKWLVDNRQIYFLPVMNPDGYEYIESSGSKNWRKNRRVNYDGSYGVDPNRNYPYKWGYDDVNSSSNPTATNYRGESPASEPETKAMMTFINDHKFRTWQNHHSANDVLVTPFGYDYKESLGTDSIIYHIMCVEQQAEYGRFRKWGPSFISYDGWALNGGTEDWSWSDSATYRLYCVITELGASMWESDAAAKVTAEKMLGADMYMIKCAGFYPILKDVTVIDDGDLCNNDGVLNPGETVKLIAEIENKSIVDTTESVTGYLSSSSSSILMKDSVGGYGNVKLLTTVDNNSDEFEFKCKSDAGNGEIMAFDLRMTWTLNGVDFEKTLPCSLQIGPLVWISSDPTMISPDAGLQILHRRGGNVVRFNLFASTGKITAGSRSVSSIRIYDVAGREVRRFDDVPTGPLQSIDWDLTNNDGQKVGNTVYFVNVHSNGREISQKFLLAN